MDAKEIIEKFGGQTALAKLIGKGQSTVAYWAKTGVIPARWQSSLLALANQHGINLSARDFVKAEASPQGLDVVERSFDSAEVVDVGLPRRSLRSSSTRPQTVRSRFRC
jgi:hypothetical protein